MQYDILIRGARLHRHKDLVDIAVKDGLFARIGTNLDAAQAARVIEAEGRLVSPPFIDAHVHLDAVLTVGQPRYNASGTLLEGIQIWGERKGSLTVEDVKRRALEEIRWEVAQGTLHIRSHVDVCDPNLTALRALLEVREEVRDICELQLVAFPQDGIFSFPEGPQLMRRAMELGCDIVGGIPHHEWTRDMGVEDVHYVFELAKEFNRDIDCHCDETDDPHSRFTEVMAADTMKQNWHGRVTTSHCTAMHSYDNAYAFKLMGLLKRAQMHVIANPFDNVVLQGRFDTYPKRRGITRVKELLANGVNVALGHDSIMDPWFPLGRGDMLAAAQLALFLCHMSGYEEINDVLDLITSNGAKALRIEDRYGLEEGKPANFLLLDAPSAFEALRLLPPRLYVFKGGREVARTTPEQSYVRRASEEEAQAVTFRPLA
ncbi:cytosine deaminase [Ktedonobacter racemifer]|uniref:Cytosine deaminase n=1 Tax=Ktedonobacter racemifer DSM 44963 TaxID=485913 RepID=D6U0A7_KTERA|nr:cytosine deaminase [Ktedonobacter racemifer]EFH82247.1 Cytosine deaminase [Ktedonobacter racemifer DSM 44963]